MELRREKQQEQSSFDDMTGGNRKTGEADTGVIISLSTTKEQIAGMKKVQTDLQGKLRVAQTEEEKADIYTAFARGNLGKGISIASSEDFQAMYQEMLHLMKNIHLMDISEMLDFIRKMNPPLSHHH